MIQPGSLVTLYGKSIRVSRRLMVSGDWVDEWLSPFEAAYSALYDPRNGVEFDRTTVHWGLESHGLDISGSGFAAVFDILNIDRQEKP